MARTVSVRELKDKLSAFLQEVTAGEVFLVTDRGRVVAELREARLGAQVSRAVSMGRQQLIERGVLRPGLPNAPDAYRIAAAVHLPTSIVDAALDR